MKLDSLNIYYISAVISGHEQQRSRLRQVFSTLSKKHKVMTEHIARDDVLAWEKSQNTGLTVPQRDFAWANDSDVAIIDYTWPTTGGGIELEYFLDVLQLPVLALMQKGVAGTKMISDHKHPLLTTREYSSLEENLGYTLQFLQQHTPEFTLHKNYVGWCGIDGSGKGVMNQAFITTLREQGARVYNAIEHMKTTNTLPDWDTVRKDYDALLVCEPTQEGLGRLIREVMINKDNPWSSRSVSQAYALNRQHLLQHLVLAALTDGAWVGTDRHELSSEHYQPAHGAMWEGESKEVLQGYVRGLEGNKLAVAHPPGLFVLAQIPAEVAKARLNLRVDEQDNAAYEKIEFMTTLATRYADPSLRTPYLRRGTQFVEFEYVDQTRPETVERAVELFRTYIR